MNGAAGSRRFGAVGVGVALLLTGVLVGWSPLPIPGGEVGLAAAAAPFGTPPPGVVEGAVQGQGLAPLGVAGPGPAEPQELIRERQAREDRERVKPVKEGFDPELSVEEGVSGALCKRLRDDIF